MTANVFTWGLFDDANDNSNCERAQLETKNLMTNIRVNLLSESIFLIVFLTKIPVAYWNSRVIEEPSDVEECRTLPGCRGKGSVGRGKIKWEICAKCGTIRFLPAAIAQWDKNSFTDRISCDQNAHRFVFFYFFAMQSYQQSCERVLFDWIKKNQ